MHVDDEDSKEFLLARVAELRRVVAIRDVELDEKKQELINTSNSYRSVITLKNQQIRSQKDDLDKKERDIERYKIDAEANLKTIIVKDAKIKELEDEIMQSKVKEEIEDDVGEPSAKRRKIVGIDNSEIADFRRMMKNVEDNTSDIKDLINQRNTETTIRARFAKISELRYTRSNTTKVAGMDWAIVVRIDNFGSKDYLSAHLSVVSNSIPESWSCTVPFTMKLIKHNSNPEESIDSKLEGVFTSKSMTWGINKLISLEDLVNPANNYVQDDSIIMEIHLKVFPTMTNSATV